MLLMQPQEYSLVNTKKQYTDHSVYDPYLGYKIKPWWRYHGDYNAQGKYHGQGTFEDQVGIYEGHWKNGNLHGLGKYTWSPENYYTGQWEDNKFHGMGLYVWTKGHYYIGIWKHNKRHGLGEYVVHGESRFRYWDTDRKKSYRRSRRLGGLNPENQGITFKKKRRKIIKKENKENKEIHNENYLFILAFILLILSFM